MRYVDEGAPLDAERAGGARPGRLARRRCSSSTATTASTRRRRGSETSVVFVPDADGARIASFGGAGERTPLWLADRLSVVRTRRDAAGRGRAVGRALRRAWSPGAATGAAGAAGLGRTAAGGGARTPGTAGRRAAVRTGPVRQHRGGHHHGGRLAGAGRTGAGLREPGGLRQAQGARSPGRDEPRGDPRRHRRRPSPRCRPGCSRASPTSSPWTTRASRWRSPPARSSTGSARTGCPGRLPTSADLDPTANGLGATYEEAWLACRFIAQEYGDRPAGALLPDGERRRLGRGGVPHRARHDPAEVRGAVARRPRPPCRGGTLRGVTRRADAQRAAVPVAGRRLAGRARRPGCRVRALVVGAGR